MVKTGRFVGDDYLGGGDYDILQSLGMCGEFRQEGFDVDEGLVSKLSSIKLGEKVKRKLKKDFESDYDEQ